MAWLQNLAGRAEDLLNKIDQNAATVLNESNSKLIDDTQTSDQLSYVIQAKEFESNNKNVPCSNPVVFNLDVMTYSDNGKEINSIPVKNKDGDNDMDSSLRNSTKSDKMSSCSSIHNSFISMDESQILNEKIAKLELDNQDLNKQLLNMQHLYSAMRNENSNLQFQIERANEQVAEAQKEKDQYIARAQRILQEKEKLLSLKKENVSGDNENVFTAYNEELKKELDFHQNKADELIQKNAQLHKQIQSLQMQHQVIQNGLQASIQSLQQKLTNEKRIRSIAEDDVQEKNNELIRNTQELHQLREILTLKDNEISRLQESINVKRNFKVEEDVESRIKSLTQTLMMKQNNLETVTTERNALKLQLERLESEYMRNLALLNKTQTKVISVAEQDESLLLPTFLRVSPFDAGVTRRVKHAYSTLDAISVRTGIFLRRYPVARVFVFCYMILLHIWVLIILFLYVPSNR